MPDIIHLLPDHIANQIAAGEVIQRPASAVKELLENAVDAGATSIHLIVTDAGKALVQVIDNGKGMSDTDVRMAFERHATSKISNIDDLFSIKTMGFRGEALASIAAVAQVEVKTKKETHELGTYLTIEHSQVLTQEPIACATGTSIAMKNLFFNVPARRSFLKSNTTELRNIIDEFTRVALAFSHIQFKLTSNNQQVYQLEQGNLKQRIVQLMGSTYNSKLVPINECTNYVNITGYVGKPDTAKRTRGDQYFFVNNRYIKSHYLNHAVNTAFEVMLQRDTYASYFLYIDVDPKQIDINVHPTKQEIKFEDEKLIYAFVQAAVKHALAQFSITPTLDFELDEAIQRLPAVSQPMTTANQHKVYSSPLYNTFTQKNQAHKIEHSSANLKSWQTFYNEQQPTQAAPAPNTIQVPTQPTAYTEPHIITSTQEVNEHELHQVNFAYILIDNGSGYTLVHQQYAHQRVLYEKLVAAQADKKMAVQQSLFPETIELTTADSTLFTDLLADMNVLGYHIEPFGTNSFVIHGTPADIAQAQGKQDIEQILEHYKNYSSQYKLDKRNRLAMSLCWQQSIKLGKVLTKHEMKHLLTQLYSCTQPQVSPFGKPIQVEYTAAYMAKSFS